MTALDADVIVVGYGPVGQTVAALLARHGHRVAVYERYAEVYGLPRAIHFDDEVMRVWQTLGIVDDIAHDLLPTDSYTWFGADGEEILTIGTPSPGPSGWEPSYLFFQPYLEDALIGAVEAQPTATVHRGWAAEALEQADDHVAVTFRRVREPHKGEVVPTDETTTVRARYVIGADGANSFVREASGIPFEDLGFRERWLTLDLLPEDVEALSHLPSPCQWCDPERPHMHTRNGRRHRRFEFMLLPGETAEDFRDEAAVWELLAPWMAPDDGTIVRHAVYEFRARLAESMRAGRAVLVGDAAHTMPPFMGQGLCSGVRDAASVAWRLDLVLRGLAPDALLDSYSDERRAHNAWIVGLSSEMGRVSCVLDRTAAAERDAALRAADAPPAVALPAHERGLLAPSGPLAGTRAVQGVVEVDGRSGRLDDLVGGGFVLVTRTAAPLPGAARQALEAIGAREVALDDVRDVDGRLTAWLDEHAVDAVLVRPDFYVFGAVHAHQDVPALLADLQSHLSLPTPTRTTADVS
jgi:2-polyprenyl-6-methoxyphenol hydroxylase-like FAD-dependent oxidoreductase